LLYSEITCLSNKYGYCYASNKYFAELYGVSSKTIKRRLYNLKKQGFINIIIERNDNNEVTCRKIFMLDIPTTVNKVEYTPGDNSVPTSRYKTEHTPRDNSVPTPRVKSVPYNNTSNNNTRINTTKGNYTTI